MAEKTYPVAGADLLESQWSRAARFWQDTGVADTPSGPALQVFSNSTGMHVFVRAGESQVRGHHHVSDAQKQIPIPAVTTSGRSRVDWIVVRLDPNRAAGSKAQIERIAGADAATGSAQPPSLAAHRTEDGVFVLPLGTVETRYGDANIAANRVTDRREFLGLRIQPCLSTARPQWPGPLQQIVETDTGRRWEWTGAGWRELGISTIVGEGTATTNVAITRGDPVTLNLAAAGVALRKGRDYRITVEAGIECSASPPMNVELQVRPGSASNTTVLKSWRITHNALGSEFRQTYSLSDEFTAGVDETNGSFHALARSLAGGSGVFTDGTITIREL